MTTGQFVLVFFFIYFFFMCVCVCVCVCVFLLFFCECASNVGSPAKFIVDDNAKVSVLMNLLYVIVFETKIKDERAKLMFLPRGKSVSYTHLTLPTRRTV